MALQRLQRRMGCVLGQLAVELVGVRHLGVSDHAFLCGTVVTKAAGPRNVSDTSQPLEYRFINLQAGIDGDFPPASLSTFIVTNEVVNELIACLPKREGPEIVFHATASKDPRFNNPILAYQGQR